MAIYQYLYVLMISNYYAIKFMKEVVKRVIKKQMSKK